MMPSCSAKAQPYLDAIAYSFFSSGDFRTWLLSGTRHENAYKHAVPLEAEQREVRWKYKPTKQPFWANYYCGRGLACVCQIEGSQSLESDAIFFLRNSEESTLAIHIEFKHPKETLLFGQPEAYPLRAACFARTHDQRKTLNSHNDWTTTLFCGEETLSDPRLNNFEKVVLFDEASRRITRWPS